jgi:recombination protein RecA
MAEDEKKRRAEKTISALQARLGKRTIQQGVEQAEQTISFIRTGFAELDKALEIGGIPYGRISEIIGIPTSGMATIALKIIANAQENGKTAVYLDLSQSFDPDYAARCGVEVKQLIVIRPYRPRQALAILQDFILDGSLSTFVFDMPASWLSEPVTIEVLSLTLNRLIAPLGKTECALIFLVSLPPNTRASATSYPQQATLPHYTAVRLLIQREKWLYRGRDIRGYQAQVQIIKNKLGGANKAISIAITFNGVVKGKDNHNEVAPGHAA